MSIAPRIAILVLLLLISSILLACGSSNVVEATRGVDLSYFQGNVSVASMTCLKEQGNEFIIIQATAGSSGRVNPYVVSDIIAARKAGFKYVDGENVQYFSMVKPYDIVHSLPPPLFFRLVVVVVVVDVRCSVRIFEFQAR